MITAIVMYFFLSVSNFIIFGILETHAEPKVHVRPSKSGVPSTVQQNVSISAFMCSQVVGLTTFLRFGASGFVIYWMLSWCAMIALWVVSPIL